MSNYYELLKLKEDLKQGKVSPLNLSKEEIEEVTKLLEAEKADNISQINKIKKKIKDEKEFIKDLKKK